MEPRTVNPLTQDLSVFKKFNFPKQPVGVKLLYRKPEGVKKLDKHMAICEMIREAQDSTEPFYITGEEEDCFGAVTLGMKGTPPFAEAGMVGHALEIFKEPRANSRIYDYLPKIHQGVVNYVLFAPLDKLTFEPDLIFIMSTVSQAEILFRAIEHLSGGPRESKTTGVFGCAWLFTYPYQTGKINWTVTGLAYGAKSKEVFPEGMILFAIPYDWIPIIIHNLNDFEWDMPSFKMGVKKFKEWESQIMGNLAKEMEENAK
jgi:uncharacterized protein (DUF169 family)